MPSKILIVQILLISLTVLSAKCLAQGTESDILSCSQLKEGIYLSFNEFRSNSPSIQSEIEYSEPTVSNVINGTLYLIDSLGYKKKYKKDLWGYCDGEKVFIKNLEGVRHLCELLTIDRYCYFLNEEVVWSQTAQGPHQSGKIYKEFILNINNGNVYKLSKDIMNEILGKDQELNADYLSDDDKKNKQRFYIEEYCKRNKDQIKPFTK